MNFCHPRRLEAQLVVLLTVVKEFEFLDYFLFAMINSLVHQFRKTCVSFGVEITSISRKFLSRDLLASYECSHPEIEAVAMRDMVILKDFISVEEEQSLLNDIEPKWRRLRYQFDHWDNAIQGYREKEITNWSTESSMILQRLRDEAFSESDKQRQLVHILDLAADGFIKPHIDATRFCGRVIAGLSLLSPSVMRLVNDSDKEKYFDVLLDRRSLYIMKDSVRYDYTHEILSNETSYFRGSYVRKDRRISIICRSEPSTVESHSSDDFINSHLGS